MIAEIYSLEKAKIQKTEKANEVSVLHFYNRIHSKK